MIKAIIFDLDHTLFDRYATLSEIAKYIREELPVNPNLSYTEIVEIMINADKAYVHYGWDNICNHIINETNLFTEKLENSKYFDFVFKYFEKIAIPYPFTIPTLTQLKNNGFKLGLITNGRPGLQEKKLELLGLGNMFDRVIVSGQYNCPKPQLKAFEMMAEWLELKPEEMMYVGDHPLNDVDASRKAGYLPVHVNTLGKWTRPDVEPCKIRIENVSELPKLLTKINGTI